MAKSVKIKHGNLLLYFMIFLFIAALVVLEGCYLYRAFVLCNEPVEATCISVETSSEASEAYDITWLGKDEDTDQTWIVTQSSTNQVAVGTKSMMYVNTSNSEMTPVTANDRSFSIVGLFGVVFMLFAVVFSMREERNDRSSNQQCGV